MKYVVNKLDGDEILILDLSYDKFYLEYWN